VLLASDLMLSSTVSGFAASAGLKFCSALTADEVAAFVAAADNVLLLVDLGAPNLDVGELANSVSEAVLQTAVAYGPHVHTERLAAAQQAGFGQVMSRGQFSAQVGRMISDAAMSVD